MLIFGSFFTKVMRGLKRKNRKPELRQASPEHTRRVLGKIANIRHTYQYLVLYLVLAVLLGHTTTVRASSVEHTGEIKEKPGLSLWKEIRNMQKLQKKKRC